jgi:hypothetical protein
MNLSVPTLSLVLLLWLLSGCTTQAVRDNNASNAEAGGGNTDNVLEAVAGPTPATPKRPNKPPNQPQHDKPAVTEPGASAFASAVDNAAAASATKSEAMAREHRVALIIGNGQYRFSPLLNPVNDARAISEALHSMGFQVTLLENATIRQMSDAARTFGDTLQRGGVGLFFYAGHGMQIKGRNYLIPVGADIQREDEVAFNAFDAGRLLEKMEVARSRVNIVILDACRNNPFSRSFRSSSQGLAQMDAPIGSYLSFATAPAKVASDGNDGNGLFTQHLLKAMRTPGLKIEEVFKRVRVKVMADSDGQQIPWDNSSLTGDFYFIQPDSPRVEKPTKIDKPAKIAKPALPASTVVELPVEISGKQAYAEPAADSPAANRVAMVEPAGSRPGLAPAEAQAAIHHTDIMHLDRASLPLSFGRQWVLDRRPNPVTKETQCILASEAVNIPDGYDRSNVQVLLTLDSIYVTADSNIDLSYPQTGIRIGAGALRSFDRLAGETAAMVSGDDVSELYARMTSSPDMVVRLGFWPTWPVTETREASYSLEDFRTAVMALRACTRM